MTNKRQPTVTPVDELVRKTDDLEALQLWRAAVTGAKHVKHNSSDGDNITIIRPERGTDRAYTLDRYSPASGEDVFVRVVAGKATEKVGGTGATITTLI